MPLMLFLSLRTLLQWFTCGGHGYHLLMNQLRHALADLRAALLALMIRLHLFGQPRRYRCSAQAETSSTIRRTRAKPAWVVQEVLRLKALMPHSSCRKIADSFNRRFAEARQMTVSKSYV